MQRPKGNDVRRAAFDGPAELAAFFRNGRLETIPAGRERRQAVLVQALALTIALTLSACTSAAAPKTVNLELSDMKIHYSTGVAAAGEVTFTVTNSGNVGHEIVVLTNRDPEIEGTRANEDSSLGESGYLALGETKTFVLNLKPGTYLLICNQAGHYVAGMKFELEVR